MAGGLFGKPFVLNIKCIIFSMICIALFLYKPNIKNQYLLYSILFLIFVIAYVSMAWYDYFYECRILPLRQSEYSWMRLIKPEAHIPEKQLDNKCKKDKNIHTILIYLSHIFLIAPIIAYVAINKKRVNPMIYPLLGVLAFFTLGYHGLGLISKSHLE
tara:strand:- start:154 stop:627 length:474 start_codon:yes stop_codon:yes gene_type:complete